MLTNRSMPRSTVIPSLAYPDVGQAIDWLCAAFGFTLRLRIANHRTQLIVGDGAMVLTSRASGSPPRSEADHSMIVRVEDVDSHYERAKKHAAPRAAAASRPPLRRAPIHSGRFGRPSIDFLAVYR